MENATKPDNMEVKVPELAQEAVMVKSIPVEKGTPIVKGFDFNTGRDLDSIMAAAMTTGFQATNLAKAIDEVNRMRSWRLSDRPIKPDEDADMRDPAVRAKVKATIFFSYTSNMVSCGMRETIRFLAQHKMVDVIVTSAGGIEEDLLKCLHPTYVGDFSLKGKDLRLKGQNRIGNLIVENQSYCKFEDWLTPILNEMTDEQEAGGPVWTPSRMIERLGREIGNEESIYYWCAKNDIPVFCPALTDGSIGDMIYFHKYKRPEFLLDISGDVKRINDIAVRAPCTGMIIVGGGLVKHHVCNANLMRNGADYAVFINTGQEYDGSDSGARPDEAVSWGKIKIDATPVKVYAEASLALPLLVAQTFAKEFHSQKAS